MQPHDVQGRTAASVLERVLEHCQSYRFDGPLDFLVPDGAVYHGPCDPAGMLAELSDEFTAEALIEAGVACRADDGRLVPGAALAGAEGVLIALRHTDAGRPFELLTDAGCLSGSRLPILAALEDEFTRRAAGRHEGDLFVAFTLLDVAVLRACGMAATLAAGLDDLSPSETEGLCRAFRWELSPIRQRRDAERERRWREAPAPTPVRTPIQYQEGTPPAGDQVRHAEVDPFSADSEGADSMDEFDRQVVFVGWTPSRLDRELHAGLRQVARHFQTLAEHVGFDLFEMTYWQPQPRAIDRLRFFARHRDARWTREALLDSRLESGDGHLLRLDNDRPRRPARPEDVASALARLHQGRTGPFEGRLAPDEQQRAWSDVGRLLDAQVIGPLLEEAMATPDPLERSLRLTAAEISRASHLHAALVNHDLSRTLGDRRTACADALPQKSLENMLAMADRLIGLSREIDRCQQAMTIDITASTVVRPCLVRGLPGSD